MYCFRCYEPQKTLRFCVRAAGFPRFYTEDPVEAEQDAMIKATSSRIVSLYDYDISDEDPVAQWIRSSRVK